MLRSLTADWVLQNTFFCGEAHPAHRQSAAQNKRMPITRIFMKEKKGMDSNHVGGQENRLVEPLVKFTVDV